MLPLSRCHFHKRPRSFFQKCSLRLHLNTHTPLTHRSRSGLTMPLSRQTWDLSGNELTRNSSGNTRSQSSQLAQPLWTDPGLKSGISVRELYIYKPRYTTYQFKKKKQNLSGHTVCARLSSSNSNISARDHEATTNH